MTRSWCLDAGLACRKMVLFVRLLVKTYKKTMSLVPIEPYIIILFSVMVHECLDKYAGMVMMPEMVRQVVLRTNIKADGGIDYGGKPFPTFFNLSWD